MVVACLVVDGLFVSHLYWVLAGLVMVLVCIVSAEKNGYNVAASDGWLVMVGPVYNVK